MRVAQDANARVLFWYLVRIAKVLSVELSSTMTNSKAQNDCTRTLSTTSLKNDSPFRTAITTLSFTRVILWSSLRRGGGVCPNIRAVEPLFNKRPGASMGSSQGGPSTSQGKRSAPQAMEGNVSASVQIDSWRPDATQHIVPDGAGICVIVNELRNVVAGQPMLADEMSELQLGKNSEAKPRDIAIDEKRSS
jgi:hypothetical protein